LSRLGFERVTLCLDRDEAGREATAKAVEHAASASASPAILVVDPEQLAPGKDPDDFVGRHGADAWSELSGNGGCGETWRALELVADVGPRSPPGERRDGLSRAAAWLGTLPPRLALEQEDALRAVAERCGYSLPAVERTFRARFWSERPRKSPPEVVRGL
jgi:hypothetical protein